MSQYRCRTRSLGLALFTTVAYMAATFSPQPVSALPLPLSINPSPALEPFETISRPISIRVRLDLDSAAFDNSLTTDLSLQELEEEQEIERIHESDYDTVARDYGWLIQHDLLEEKEGQRQRQIDNIMNRNDASSASSTPLSASSPSSSDRFPNHLDFFVDSFHETPVDSKGEVSLEMLTWPYTNLDEFESRGDDEQDEFDQDS